jgi:hypothetical protein
MGIDVLVAVGGVTEAVRRGTRATGAVAGSLRRATVAGPHQPVLLVVARDFGFAASGVVGSRNHGLGGGRTGDVAGGIIAQRLAVDGASGATASKAFLMSL